MTGEPLLSPNAVENSRRRNPESDLFQTLRNATWWLQYDWEHPTHRAKNVHEVMEALYALEALRHQEELR